MPRLATSKKTRTKAKSRKSSKSAKTETPPPKKSPPEAPSLFHHIRHAKKRAFLAAYAQIGTITHSAKAAGVDRTLHHVWMKADKQYVEAFAVAEQCYCDMLEGEATRRAVKGVSETIFYKGVPIGTKINYSDTLLIFKMKGHIPEKYGDTPGGGGMNINVNIVDAQAVMKRLDAETPQALQLDTAKGQSGDMIKAVDATVIGPPQQS